MKISSRFAKTKKPREPRSDKTISSAFKRRLAVARKGSRVPNLLLVTREHDWNVEIAARHGRQEIE